MYTLENIKTRSNSFLTMMIMMKITCFGEKADRCKCVKSYIQPEFSMWFLQSKISDTLWVKLCYTGRNLLNEINHN